MSVVRSQHDDRATTPLLGRDDDLGSLDRLLEDAEDLVTRDPAGCAELLERADQLLTGVSDQRSRAVVRQLRGELAAAQGRLHEALAHFRLAHRAWTAVGEQVLAQRAVLGRVAVLIELGELVEALTVAQRVVELLSQHPEHACEEDARARLHATAYRLIGEAQTFRGEQDRGMASYTLAENLFRALGDDHGVGRVHLGRGRALLVDGVAHQALAELTRARRHLRAAGDRHAADLAALHGATALGMVGRLSAALEVLDLLQPAIAGNAVLRAAGRLARGLVLLQGGLADRAHSELVAAEAELAERAMLIRSAAAALAAAMASHRAGRLEEAAAGHEEVDRLFAAHGALQLRRAAWISQARVALHRGDHDLVTELCGRLVAAGGSSAGPVLTASAHLLLSDVATDPRAARDHLVAASRSPAMLAVPEMRLELGLRRARLQRRDGELLAALEELRRTAEIGRAWDRDPDSHGPGVAQAVLGAVEAELVDGLLEHGGHAATVEAWQWASTAKLRLFERVAAPARPSGAGDAADAAGLVDALLAQGESVRRRRRRSRRPTLPRVPERPVLDFHVHGDDVLAFVLRDGQVSARRLPAAGRHSRELLRGWHQECALAVAAPAGLPTDSPSLSGLERVLVAPVADLIADLLEGDDDDGPLLIVGHEHLNDVPFEALPAIRHSRRPDAVAFAPGLAAAPAPAVAPGEGVLVLAASDRDAPAIAEEGRAIQDAAHGVELYLDGDATSEVLAARAPGRAVVHIACHGRSDPGNPLDSSLLLADGRLTARRLAATDLRGAVVVLSACAAGVHAGSGVEPTGLVWACVAAGARGVVAASWSVDDAATAELMTHFYRRIDAGQSPQAALEAARRQVAAAHPHPYFWGSFRYVAAPGYALAEPTCVRGERPRPVDEELRAFLMEQLACSQR